MEEDFLVEARTQVLNVKGLAHDAHPDVNGEVYGGRRHTPRCQVKARDQVQSFPNALPGVCGKG